MLSVQEFADNIALVYAREPWQRIIIRVRSFVAACRVDDRDWYPRMLAFVDRVIAEELAAQQQTNEGG